MLEAVQLCLPQANRNPAQLMELGLEARSVSSTGIIPASCCSKFIPPTCFTFLRSDVKNFPHALYPQSYTFSALKLCLNIHFCQTPSCLKERQKGCIVINSVQTEKYLWKQNGWQRFFCSVHFSRAMINVLCELLFKKQSVTDLYILVHLQIIQILSSILHS